MTNKTKSALLIAIVLWASAFVGIRVGLQGYSPAGLALLRYIVASLFIAVIYYRLPARNTISLRDGCALLANGVVGIGIYNIALNYGEIGISSGVASFIVSQSPIITAMFALVFLGEKLNTFRVMGFIVSMLGVALIAIGQENGFSWSMSLFYVLIATVAGSVFIVMQKPYLKKYHAIEATAFVIWGGTLFLSIYSADLYHDLLNADWGITMMVIYLGIFPAALGYLAWSYVLHSIPATRAASALYFMPFVATLMGWMLLGEVPVILSLVGGLLAIFGVVLVNKSYLVQT